MGVEHTRVTSVGPGNVRQHTDIGIRRERMKSRLWIYKSTCFRG